MADDVSAFERFINLVKRELRADDVRLLTIGETAPDTDNVIVSRLDDGRQIVASFGAPPAERDVLARRLTILASTFAFALETPPSEKMRARPPVVTSLHEELKALAARARAIDVVVIDTDSPVVWGSASVPARPRARNELLLREVSDRELATKYGDDSGPLQDVVPDAAEEAAAPRRDSSPVPAESSRIISDGEEKECELHEESETTRRAIAAVRRLPALDGLHKGRHLRHVQREGDYFLAISFSGIYILCLVFDGDFDELRAERAAADALPRVERLVLALPPLDPQPPRPMGSVVALRARRRR
jgi:Trp operon repressor